VTEGFPPTLNDGRAVALGEAVAQELGGADAFLRMAQPIMGAEDFSYMLNEKPGCYVWLGQRGDSAGEGSLHHPKYNFNDDALPIGASYFATLVEEQLASAA